jgi:hypothetical protein
MAGTHDDSETAADPGDFGRRVAQRRHELGLDRDEIAARAGVDPRYLQHVEEQASANPTPSATARIAAALETTVEWLNGAGLGVAPGPGSGEGVPVLMELDEEDCLRRLEKGGVGRVVFVDERGPSAYPVAYPVNFRMSGTTPVFRTGDGGMVAAVHAGGTMSLEADHLDEVLGEGWSVLLSGVPREVVDPDRLRVIEDLHVEPWSGGDRPHVIEISVNRVSGRQIHRRPPDRS